MTYIIWEIRYTPDSKGKNLSDIFAAVSLSVNINYIDDLNNTYLSDI